MNSGRVSPQRTLQAAGAGNIRDLPPRFAARDSRGDPPGNELIGADCALPGAGYGDPEHWFLGIADAPGGALVGGGFGITDSPSVPRYTDRSTMRGIRLTAASTWLTCTRP